MSIIWEFCTWVLDVLHMIVQLVHDMHWQKPFTQSLFKGAHMQALPIVLSVEHRIIIIFDHIVQLHLKKFLLVFKHLLVSQNLFFIFIFLEFIFSKIETFYFIAK